MSYTPDIRKLRLYCLSLSAISIAFSLKFIEVGSEESVNIISIPIKLVKKDYLEGFIFILTLYSLYRFIVYAIFKQKPPWVIRKRLAALDGKTNMHGTNLEDDISNFDKNAFLSNDNHQVTAIISEAAQSVITIPEEVKKLSKLDDIDYALPIIVSGVAVLCFVGSLIYEVYCFYCFFFSYCL